MDLTVPDPSSFSPSVHRWCIAQTMAIQVLKGIASRKSLPSESKPHWGVSCAAKSQRWPLGSLHAVPSTQQSPAEQNQSLGYACVQVAHSIIIIISSWKSILEPLSPWKHMTTWRSRNCYAGAVLCYAMLCYAQQQQTQSTDAPLHFLVHKRNSWWRQKRCRSSDPPSSPHARKTDI